MTIANPPAEGNAERQASAPSYAIVFVALLLLLALTVGLSFVDVDRLLPGRGHGFHWAIWIAVGVAATKALLIVLYFMHLRAETWRIVMFAGAGFACLAICFALTFADYATRHAPGIEVKGEPRMFTR